ncbi:hTAFII28-like protein conserved region-domain-containing protein [Podospora didyma]|uniref:HTAFII28-like protein conserved region-domain-containing protein n=1 Tax=Podospora didyma TaxID=330526 RepID=A0AAE0K5W8_9PEZI|nr:hTAFII28-like protein conserved region-domain-containing protein [Podospora didyma]
MTSKKRPTDGGGGTPSSASKRRKPSAISTTSGLGSAHPLRQTSFPPDEAGTPYDMRSPSIDFDNMSLVSGSQVSIAAPPKGKKRGRKSKAEKTRETTPSVAGGSFTKAASGVSDGGTGSGKGGGGKSSARGGAGDGDDADADDDGPTEVAATADIQTKEQKEEEHRVRGMLMSAFSPEQFDRYEHWRAGNLGKAGVRRLINATISQSVAENIVIGVRSIAKVFIGDIIEGARRVQTEWIEKTGEKQTDLPTPPPSAKASPNPAGEGQETQPDKSVDMQFGPGPLRPDHLREAMRRYKRSLEGGGVGMQAIWHQHQQNGIERFPSRTGGRRIFR